MVRYQRMIFFFVKSVCYHRFRIHDLHLEDEEGALLQNLSELFLKSEIIVTVLQILSGCKGC